MCALVRVGVEELREEVEPEALGHAYGGPTKHKSSHNFSTRHFNDKVTSDLDFLAHLAPKNNIMSFSPVLHTPCH